MQQTSRFFNAMAIGLLVACAAPTMTRAATTDTAGTADGVNLIRAQSLSGAYLAAKSAQIDGDLQTATDFYAQALALDPTSELLQKDAMFAFLADGQLKQGADLAAKLRDDADAGKVARITLGVDALKKGDFEAAIGEFDVVDPSDLDTLLLGQLTAWAELGAGDVDPALSRIDQLKGAPWFSIFNGYQKGLMATVSGRPDVARAAFKKVIDDKTSARTSPDAYLAAAESLARLEARSKDEKAALAAVDSGLSVAPTYDPLVSLKDRIGKGETIEHALSGVQEGAAEALYILGQAINRGDGQQVAILYFQLAHSLAPRSPALLTAMAGIAERGERFQQAIEYYRQIPENTAYHRTADLQIGLDLWYAKKKDEAKVHLRSSIKEFPANIQGYTAFADVMSSDEQYGPAADALDKAISLAEKDDTATWNLYYQRGIAFERTKQWSKAEPDFKKALDLSPNQPQVLNYLGYSWVDRDENLKEGLDMIKSAVELRPNDGYIIDSLGWAYYRLARYADAVDELERAVLITPMDPTINDHLGDAYWQVGRKREARFQWERALIGDPQPEAEAVKTIKAKLASGLERSTRKAEAGSSSDSEPASGTPKAAATKNTPAPALKPD